jgi:hypothetical protein
MSSTNVLFAVHNSTREVLWVSPQLPDNTFSRLLTHPFEYSKAVEFARTLDAPHLLQIHAATFALPHHVPSVGHTHISNDTCIEPYGARFLERAAG